MSKLVAITGASGFVGPHLVAALVRHGWKVRLLLRRWTPLPSLAGVEAEVVWGDLDDAAALHRLVAGADAIVHAAGLIKARDPAQFMAVNRDGTARLAALAPGVPFLLLSSLAAREPQLSPYAASKRAGEAALAGRPGPWFAVRAPAVYGPGDRETLAYFKAAQRGIGPQPAGDDARLSMIHVEDLAEALALALGLLRARALDHPSPSEIYEVDDGWPGGYPYKGMADAAAAAFGRRVAPLSLPRPVMAAVAWANAVRQRLGGPPQMLTRWKVAEIFHHDWAVHDRRLAEATGFTALYDLWRGFAETVRWYRRQGWLKTP